MALGDLGAGVADANLKGLWHLNGTTGTNAPDTSGNNNNGPLAASPATPTWTTAGKFSNALSFDGVDDYVSVADSASMRTTGDWTREVWVKSTTPSGGDGAVHEVFGQRTTTNKFLLRVNANGTWIVYYCSVSGCASGFVSLPTFTRTPNTWQHIAVVKSGTNIQPSNSIFILGHLFF